MTMMVIAAVADFERDLLNERTQSGLVRAKSQGKTIGSNTRFWRSCDQGDGGAFG